MSSRLLKARALVTNCTSTAGLLATRSLARAGCEVLNVDVSRFALGLRSRYALETFKLADSAPQQLGADLLELVRRVQPDLILPVGSNFAAAISARVDEFAALAALNFPSPESFLAGYDKRACIRHCQKLGIPCARLLSAVEAENMLDRASGGPVLVVKPDRDIGASAGVRYIRDRRAFEEQTRHLGGRFDSRMVQEFIPGGRGSMRTVVVLFSQRSELTAAFTLRKTLEWPPTGGLTAVGHSTDDPDLVRMVLPFFEKFRWKGPAEVELRVDARDGCPKVIEINPRVPSYIDFARRCGLDVIHLAARLALDEPVEPFRYPAYTVGAGVWSPFLCLRVAVRRIRPGMRPGQLLARAWNILRTSESDLGSLVTDPGALLGRCLRDFRIMVSPRR